MGSAYIFSSWKVKSVLTTNQKWKSSSYWWWKMVLIFQFKKKRFSVFKGCNCKKQFSIFKRIKSKKWFSLLNNDKWFLFFKKEMKNDSYFPKVGCGKWYSLGKPWRFWWILLRLCWKNTSNITYSKEYQNCQRSLVLCNLNNENRFPSFIILKIENKNCFSILKLIDETLMNRSKMLPPLIAFCMYMIILWITWTLCGFYWCLSSR